MGHVLAGLEALWTPPLGGSWEPERALFACPGGEDELLPPLYSGGNKSFRPKTQFLKHPFLYTGRAGAGWRGLWVSAPAPSGPTHLGTLSPFNRTTD